MIYDFLGGGIGGLITHNSALKTHHSALKKLSFIPIFIRHNFVTVKK